MAPMTRRATKRQAGGLGTLMVLGLGAIVARNHPDSVSTAAEAVLTPISTWLAGLVTPSGSA